MIEENNKNEFDDIDNENVSEFNSTTNVTNLQEELIQSGSAGVVYDYTKAPNGVKAPPRVDLDGKVVTIKKADIILPTEQQPWLKTKAGDKEYKPCKFIVYYDIEGQQEFISGISVFAKITNGKKLYSHPTINRNGKTQATKLLKAYADYKQKDINECTLKEFMSFLNGQPKVQIKAQQFQNPQTDELVTKNIPFKFV